jgi:hypothetical protein
MLLDGEADIPVCGSAIKDYPPALSDLTTAGIIEQFSKAGEAFSLNHIFFSYRSGVHYRPPLGGSRVEQIEERLAGPAGVARRIRATRR